MTKREMTPQESEDCLRALQNYDSAYNRGREWIECLSEGLKDEICDCGKAFLACQHFVRCFEDNCPMKSQKDKRSLLQMLGDQIKEGEK